MPNAARVAPAGAGGFSLNGPASVPPAPAATQTNTGIVPPWLRSDPMVDESMTDRTRMARELDDLRSLRGALTDALNALRWASAENSAVALGIQEELRGMFRQLRDEVQPAVIDAHDGLAIEMGMR